MGWRRCAARCGAVVVAVGVSVVVSAPAHAADDPKYALVNNCYALTSAATGAPVAKVPGGGYAATATASPEAFRMQATALGRYMLYGRDRDFLARGAKPTDVSVGTQPGPSADFTVDDASAGSFTLSSAGDGRRLVVGDGGRLVLADPGTGGDAARFTFTPASGCAVFPEAEVNATGAPSTGPTPYSEVSGLLDAHMHMMAYEFLGGDLHCGRPWSPYGITVALAGCSKGPVNTVGSNLVDTVLHNPEAETQDPVGWPTFKSWPSYDSLTHENSYYKWLERAWRGGLRVFVNLFVENHALCEAYPIRRNSCNEMASVRLQSNDLHALQDYIDAQNGGPGKGWFRIVSDPYQAREVINSGKLAVVPGIEVSNLFDCTISNGLPNCTAQDVDRRLDEVYDMGVRDMELINKFDNAFGGVAGDAGQTGLVVNGGNRLETGQFWQMQPCTGPPEESDREQYALPGTARDQLVGNLLQQLVPLGTLPVYPPGPQCNQRGLTTLGEHLVRRMMDKRMIIDPDHLDVISRKRLLDLVEARRYSGIISSHSWSTPDAYPRIYRLGGMVTPYAGDSRTFVKAWREIKPTADKRFTFGFGYGADMNGFGAQGGPRHGQGGPPVTYPFKSFDGKVTLDRERTGSRVWDINDDGVAQYGLYPDWIEDLRKLAGDGIVKDMSRGPEAYLEMWERAIGVADPGCRSARLRFTSTGLGTIKLRMSAEDVLRTGGQPAKRVAHTWRYCARAGGRVSTVFTPTGVSGLIVSTAPHHRVDGVGRGSVAAAVTKRARSVGRGIYIRSAGRNGVRFVYGVADGKVRYAGVASSTASHSPSRLRSYLKLAGLAS